MRASAFKQSDILMATVAVVGDELREGLRLARVRLACGRMVGGLDAMLECYRFGVREGPHGEPWGPGYHREAVDIYNESLPWTYQRDIAKLFRDSLSAMAGGLDPSGAGFRLGDRDRLHA